MKKYRVSTLSEKALYIVIGGILLLTPVGVSAAETNLSKALKSGKKTIEFTGKEKQSVRIPKGVTVIGSGPEKSVISNDIVLADGASLKNLTVSGKVIAITLDKGASVTLENVTVTGASDSGVFAPLGGGTLTMKNSRVQNNRKGIFLLRGKGINLSGTTLQGNKEEGLDIHGGAGGSLTGNVFSKNGEGGVEVIIDGSSLSVTNNTFADNASSGIALQSYGGEQGLAKTGKFILQNNTFRNNGNFGVDCKNPQGVGGAYFAGSTRATDNSFAANKKGTIAGTCFFANRQTESEEEKKEDIEETLEEAREEKEAVAHAEEIFEAVAPKSLYGESIESLESRRLSLEKEEAKPFGQWKKEFLNEREALQNEATLLRGQVQGCVRVSSYEVSMREGLSESVCTKEAQEQYLQKVMSIQEGLLMNEKKTWLGKGKVLFKNVRSYFLERDVWKFL